MDLQVPGGKGTTLAWEWELDQKDIGFSVSLLALPLASAASPLQLADANTPEEVVPVRKHFAGERVVGSYEYPRSGTLSLVWNNEYSWVCIFSHPPNPRAFTRTHRQMHMHALTTHARVGTCQECDLHLNHEQCGRQGGAG
jgi:hypothetical protein